MTGVSGRENVQEPDHVNLLSIYLYFYFFGGMMGNVI